MPNRKLRNKTVLIFFNHLALPDLQRIRNHELPSDRLYGVVELLDRGWDVAPCDERLYGRFGKIVDKLRSYGFNPINLRSISRMASRDLILIKDDFSLAATLAAKILRKKLVYVDSLFALPRNRIKRALLGINLRMAPMVVCYSHYQARLWSELFRVSPEKFRIMSYGIDWPFYKDALRNSGVGEDLENPYVLSVGRDVGRDFDTLVRATANTGLRLKLVTLPYAVPASARAAAHVDIIERVSYHELFRLYAGARMVAVPIKPETIYPSGIRAVMESLAVGRATIASRTEVLEEYVPDDAECITYVEPGNVRSLRDAVLRLNRDPELRKSIAQKGRDHARANFQMAGFVDQLEELLQELSGFANDGGSATRS